MAEYAQVVLSQIRGAQTQVQQQMGAPQLPPPQAGSPEMFGQGGGYTEGPSQTPRTEGMLRETGQMPAEL